MKKIPFLSVLVLILITAAFFYKTVIWGHVPFPGDLLVSEYNPWKTYSYLGYVPGSYPSKVQYFDTIRQIYPWRDLVIDQIKNWEVPLWNPYNFSGSPLLANFQSAVFYPFNILFLLLPFPLTWTILIVIQPLLASLFTYLFVRKIGVAKIGAILSGISYGFCLYMATFLEYSIIGNTILWLPFLLYCSEQLLQKRTIRYTVLLILGLLFCFFAGHIQIFSFTLFFVILYFVFRVERQFGSLRKRAQILSLYLLSLLLGMGITAAQLLPTIELIQSSARVSQDYQFLIEKLLIQPSQLIVFLSPDFFGNPATRNYLLSDAYPGNALYIGLIPFLLSFLSLYEFKKNAFIRFFWLSAVILLVLFVRTPLSEFFYMLNIPFLSTGSPTNAIFLLSFCMAVLAGFGLDVWMSKKTKYSILLFLAGFVCLGIVLIVSSAFQFNFSKNNLYYSLLLYALFLVLFGISYFFIKLKRAVVIFLVILTIADLFYFFHKFNPFVPQGLIYPSSEVVTFLQKKAGINRVWGFGSAEIQSNFATYLSVYSPEGYDPLYPKLYGEFIESSSNGKIQTTFTNKNRSDAVVAYGFDNEHAFYRLRVLDSLGVKYILDRVENASTEKTFPEDRFSLIYEKNGWRVFENKKAAPRFFLTSAPVFYNSTEEFEKVFFASDFDPTSSALIRTEREISLSQGTPGASLVDLLEYEPNKVLLETKSEADTFLVLSDSYFPGWKAFVDTKETQIYRANHALRAVSIPKGRHSVSFIYMPDSFSMGVKISIMSLVLFLGYLVFLKIRYE